ncbi:MAG: hypothetical protein U0264_06535 [Candidatus Kapaibacterium sp.]
MTYAELAPSLQTGDVILFQGFDLSGFLIEALEAELNLPPYSHVGIVMRLPDGNSPSGLYFWQAAPPPTPGNDTNFGPDYIKGVVSDGCQLVSLDNVMAWAAAQSAQGPSTSYLLAARHLTPAISADDATTMMNFVRFLVGRSFSYPVGEGMMIDYAEGAVENKQSPNTTFFCSKLASATYQACGILPPSPVPNVIAEPTMITNNILPGDFGQTGTRLQFLKGYSLGDEISFTAS